MTAAPLVLDWSLFSTSGDEEKEKNLKKGLNMQSVALKINQLFYI